MKHKKQTTEAMPIDKGNGQELGIFFNMQLAKSIPFETKTKFLCSDGTKVFTVDYEHYVTPKRRMEIEKEILSAPQLKAENEKLKKANLELFEHLKWFIERLDSEGNIDHVTHEGMIDDVKNIIAKHNQ